MQAHTLGIQTQKKLAHLRHFHIYPWWSIHSHYYQYIYMQCKSWFSLRKTFLRTGTDRKVSFVLEPLIVPIESSQDKGSFPVRSHPEETYLEWKPALKAVCSLLYSTCTDWVWVSTAVEIQASTFPSSPKSFCSTLSLKGLSNSRFSVISSYLFPSPHLIYLRSFLYSF